MGGTVSIRELSLNAVKSNKPKMLPGDKPGGLSQKATERAQGLSSPLSWASGGGSTINPTRPTLTAELRGPEPSGHSSGTW